MNEMIGCIVGLVGRMKRWGGLNGWMDRMEGLDG